MFSFSLVRSTQMRTLSLVLGTTTIPAHHSVGSSTLEMMSSCSIRESSSFTFDKSGMGTLRGVLSAKVLRQASVLIRSNVFS